MPLPTDKVSTIRTFRQCAGDPVGTEYHVHTFVSGSGRWTFRIYRGHEALLCSLVAPSLAEGKDADNRSPVLHGLPGFHVPSVSFTWSYDLFGDCVFSSLLTGAYRDSGAKEWGTKEVFEDCIDEIRRVIGIGVPVESSQNSVVGIRGKNTFGKAKRRLLL